MQGTQRPAKEDKGTQRPETNKPIEVKCKGKQINQKIKRPRE